MRNHRWKFLLLAVLGCAPDPDVELYQMALEAQDVEEVGQVTWVKPADPAELPLVTEDRSSGRAPVESDEDWLSLEHPTGKISRHRFHKQAMRDLWDTFVRYGKNRGADPDHAPASRPRGRRSPEQQRPTAADTVGAIAGWSLGVDNRIPMGIAQGYPANDSLLAPIGMFKSQGQQWCSGVLVGARVVLTAAHCLVDHESRNPDGSWKWAGLGTITFAARHDGSRDVDGDGYYWHDMYEPYGEQFVRGVWVPGPWWDGTCTGWGVCAQYDIGIAILDFTPGAGSYGFDGNISLDTMKTWYTRNVGYPGCLSGGPLRPAGCVNLEETAWGDPNDCDIGNGWSGYPDRDGWRRSADIRCDLNSGHSGSPVFFPRCPSTGNTKCVLAVVSRERCGTAEDCKLIQFANTVTRLTPSWAGVLASIIAQNP